MALKDLTAYLIPDLQLPLAGKTYNVRPPTKDNGLKLAAIVAVGSASVSGDANQATEEQRELYAAIEQEELSDLALGADVAAEMVADNVPVAHIGTAAQYAMYYWVLGEAAADAIMSAQVEARGGGSPKGAPSSRSKSGRSTASGSRKPGSTASRSTRTTAPRRN